MHGLNHAYSEWDQFRSNRLITESEEYLFKIKKEKADKERLLRELREINTYKHEVVNGTYRGTAQQIAQRVASEESTFSWLQDNVISGETVCPISNIEFKELIRLYREMPEDYCSELRKELVNRDVLPDVGHFIKITDDEQKARLDMTKFESQRGSMRYRIIQNVPETNLGSLHKSISDLIVARHGIRGRFEWVEQATLDILSGNESPWNNLHDFMNKHLRNLDEKIVIAQTLEIQFAGNTDVRKLKADSLDLLGHLEAGGGMGWKFLAPSVVRQNRYITKEIKVNGRVCKTSEQLKLLITYLEAMDEIDLLWSAFQGKDKREEGSLLLQVGYLRERLETLYEVLKLKSLLATARKCLKTINGLAEPRWEKLEDLEEIIFDIQAAESENTFKKVVSIIEQAIQNVRIAQSSTNSHDLNHEIQVALEGRNSQALGQCLEKLELLEKGRAALHERESLNERLRIATPKLERQLENTFNDSFWDERINNFESAWAWKLADNWVREFGREHNEIALEASLKQLTTEEQKVISRLSATKAWDNCLRKLTAFQRSNLIAWATAMRKMPKTLTAKTRPKWLREAQQCMDNCRGAIPAWIMPLYRVFETIPPTPECFDVVIIDEASQTGPEGLVLQYLAKQIIIVGDAQQISPDAIGVPEDEIDALIKRYLDDIPFKGFYTPTTSLFAFAEILFSGKIVLREHFRCMPEIIQFSNQLCYTGTPLKPLRQYPPRRLEPILLRYVKDGFREGSTNNVLNRPEADAVVEGIVEMCSSKEYAGKTIGVISLQGEAQAKYIEGKLLTSLSPTDMETRRIVCGDAYAFQGDERDIMFLSMVAAPNERIGVLNKEADKRRFNVAASRAKDQVILFHSVTLNDLHPECMRYKLLEYYLNPTRQVWEIDLSKCESQFERDVCQAIIGKGYKVIPQYTVAEYRIDMVVEGTKSQLAVECDGDEWHGTEYYERDMARQRILERCGWRFWRIRGHEYYRNRTNALEPLWKALSDAGIKPPSISDSESETPVESNEPSEQVISEHQITSVEENPKVETTIEAPPIVHKEIYEETNPNLVSEKNHVYTASTTKATLKAPNGKREIIVRKKDGDKVVTVGEYLTGAEACRALGVDAGVSSANLALHKAGYLVFFKIDGKQFIPNYQPLEYTEKTAENKNAISNFNKSEVYSYPPQFYFKLAHHAKESAKFYPWERRLIFNIGTYLTRGWKITEKMERQAIRILQTSRQLGLVDTIQQELDSGQVQKPVKSPDNGPSDSV